MAVASSLFVLAVAPTALAVTMDWTPVGAPGNAADTTGYGAVDYNYSIGTYEVTNAQYTEFLNAKAATDTLGLYSVAQGSAASGGGITRSGVSGSFTYTTIAGRADRPVNFVTFYDALRFANWMNNGQGSGDTETGAYTLLGGLETPVNGLTVTRNAGASIALTGEDEWYKAAYYDAVSTSYFDFPAGSNTLIVCSAPTATPNTENCENAVGSAVNKGSYTGSPSPVGTFDQGGNVREWNESVVLASFRGLRGGSYSNFAFRAGADNRQSASGGNQFADTGFRLSLIPEPGTGLLLGMGLIALAARRRSAAR